MKRVITLFATVLFVSNFFIETTYAEEKAVLGVFNAAAKISYLGFTDNVFDEKAALFELGEETTVYKNNGTYYSIESYYNIWRNLYLGAEIGYVNAEKNHADWINQRIGSSRFVSDRDLIFNDYTVSIEYLPIQANLKYLFEPINNLVLTSGAGMSYNRAEIAFEFQANREIDRGSGISSGDDSFTEWLWGAQLFVEALYKWNQFFVGINATYQITEDWPGVIEDNVNFNNYRMGATVGLSF